MPDLLLLFGTALVSVLGLLFSSKRQVERRISQLSLHPSREKLTIEWTLISIRMALIRRLLLVNRLYAILRAASVLSSLQVVSGVSLAILLGLASIYEISLMLLGLRFRRDEVQLTVADLDFKYCGPLTGRTYLLLLSSTLITLPFIYELVLRTLFNQ